MTRARRIQASPPPISAGEAAALRALSRPASRLVLDERGVELRHCRWEQLAERARELGGVDATFPDCPYSAITHAGHDSAEAYDESGAPRDNKVRYELGLAPTRRGINYPAWTADDVAAFVATWAPLTRGWFGTVTDHVLAPAWEAAMEAADRYVFAPIPFVSPGSRVRLSGDGPSSWTCWIIVSRPKTREFLTWGTLPGAYVLSPERGMPVVGGKPVSLMRALVRDYTRPNDLVADPCAGAGTLGVACIAEGRRALLGDMDAAHVAIAAKRLRSCPGEQKRLTLDVDAKPMTQTALGETGT